MPGWQIAQVPLGHGIVNIQYQVLFEEYVQADKPGMNNSILKTKLIIIIM
jgi:hypothetical protein